MLTHPAESIPPGIGWCICIILCEQDVVQPIYGVCTLNDSYFFPLENHSSGQLFAHMVSVGMYEISNLSVLPFYVRARPFVSIALVRQQDFFMTLSGVSTTVKDIEAIEVLRVIGMWRSRFAFKTWYNIAIASTCLDTAWG